MSSVVSLLHTEAAKEVVFVSPVRCLRQTLLMCHWSAHCCRGLSKRNENEIDVTNI